MLLQEMSFRDLCALRQIITITEKCWARQKVASRCRRRMASNSQATCKRTICACTSNRTKVAAVVAADVSLCADDSIANAHAISLADSIAKPGACGVAGLPALMLRCSVISVCRLWLSAGHDHELHSASFEAHSDAPSHNEHDETMHTMARPAHHDVQHNSAFHTLSVNGSTFNGSKRAVCCVYCLIVCRCRPAEVRGASGDQRPQAVNASSVHSCVVSGLLIICCRYLQFGANTEAHAAQIISHVASLYQNPRLASVLLLASVIVGVFWLLCCGCGYRSFGVCVQLCAIQIQHQRGSCSAAHFQLRGPLSA